MKKITKEQIKKGQAVYTKTALNLYDLWVVYFSNHFLWCCPKGLMLTQYQENLSDNHLDIGVGTGYYLKHCQWPQTGRLSLMDINENSLNKARQSLVQQKNVSMIHADIHQPQPRLTSQFKSISMNYLLHCLPGNMLEKSQVIQHATDMLTSGGILFGATILGEKTHHNWMGYQLQDFYQKKGIFSNQEDTEDMLIEVLSNHLKNVSVKRTGAVALFSGQK